MSIAVITVRNSTELREAVERLAAGEGGTVVMEAGRYALDLRDAQGRVDAPVRLTSADPENPAVFTNVTMHGRENVSIDNVVFDSRDVAVSNHHRDLELTGSKGISVSDSVFRGAATESLDGTPGQLKAVNLALIRGSEGIVLRDNQMSGYNQGVAFKDSSDIVFTGNDLTRFQGDGIRIAGVQDILIEGNHLHGMLGASWDINHGDMIQIWGNDISQNNERITIRDNIFNTADSPSYQMIFGHNEDIAENGWLFEDIVIEGNLLYGAHYHMISVAHTDRMVVRSNTVLWNQDTHTLLAGGGQGASNNGWIRDGGSPTAVIENNIASHIDGPTGSNGLVTYGDPGDPRHVSHHFVNLDAGATADLRDLSMRPDSLWDGVLGAPMTWSTHQVDGLTATASVARVAGDRSRITLDAGFSRDEAGPLGEGATYTWIFADGTREQGLSVEHDFVTPGLHAYSLEVRAGDGRTDLVARTLRVTDPDLLAIEIRDGELRDLSSYKTYVTAHDGAFEGEGFRLDGTSRIEVSKYAGHVFSLDSFALSLTFAPEAGTSGTLIELHRAMEARIEADGRFTFAITTTEGQFRVTTAPGAVSGTEPVELAVIMDGAAGELRLLIDGEVAGSAPVSGLTTPIGSGGLNIGNVFGGTSVKGVVSDIRLRGEPALAPDPLPIPASEPAPRPGLPLDDAALLVRLDFDGGIEDGSDRGTHVAWDEGAVVLGEGSGGTSGAVALGDRYDGVTLTRWNPHLYDLDAFHIAFDLRRGDLDAGGHIMTLHRSFGLSVDELGLLTFELTTTEGEAVAQSREPVLADTDWHAVEMAYDGAKGLMQLVVDGVVVGEAQVTGSTLPVAYWGVSLGRLWGGEADGWMDALRIYDEAYLRPSPVESAAPGLAAAGDVACADPEMGTDMASRPETLAAFDFEGDLIEAGGRRVGVWTKGDPDFTEGREVGQALRIGAEGAVTIARETAFLHERDAFALAFDLRKDAASEDGRVLHLHKALDAWVVGEEFVFSLRTDEGQFRVSTRGAALGDDDWHRIEIGYDDAARRLALTVDGETVEATASGTTAPGLSWGLSLGAAWGDALEGAIDGFRLDAAPDWALG